MSKRGFTEGVVDLTEDSPPPRKLSKFEEFKRGPSRPHSAERGRDVAHASWMGFRTLSRQQETWSHPFREVDSSRQHTPASAPARQRPVSHFFRGSSARAPVPVSNLFQDFPDPSVFSHPSEQFRSRLNPNPDSFDVVAKELSALIPEDEIHTGGPEWKNLTSSVMQIYSRKQQTLDTMQQKIQLWKEIYRVIRLEFDCGLFIFGSTFNGFGSDDCDVDMCLFPQGAEYMQAKKKLDIVRKLLRKHCSHFIRGGIELIPAKVPILKFKDKQGNLEVDLSVDNPTSIRNTHLLYYYSKSDYRVRPLVLAVKMWAKHHGINEAKNQTLSSYTLTLMLIHFLQAATRPQVLPCLHSMYPHIFHMNSNIFGLDYTDTPAFKSENTESAGALLTGFFKYYSSVQSFDPSRDVASVRTGTVLDGRDCEEYARREKLSPGQWSAKLLVEEPFDRTNAARAVCSQEKWDLVRSVFQRTSAFLDSQDIKKLSFNDLLSKL